MIRGIFETHIHVLNLEKSMEFYQEVIGLELGLKEEGRRIAFYWVGGKNQGMLGLWEKKPEEIVSQHFAFQIPLSEMDKAIEGLRAKGIKGYNFLGDGTDNPMVFGWMPALAIYFDDPDGHVLEYIAPLEGDPRPELAVVSREKWQEEVGP